MATRVTERMKAMRRFTTMMLGMALATGAAAAAADWHLAGESDRQVSYLDLGSIAKADGKARFSRWMILRAPMSSGADNLKDSLEADCATRTYRVVGAEAFKAERSSGKMAAGAGVAEPGTVTASLIDIACGKRPADAAPVADPYAAGKARFAAPAKP